MLHVADGSADDDQLDAMVAAVEEVLEEIGAEELPVQLVLNKIDRVDEIGRRRLEQPLPRRAAGLGVTGEGLEELKARLAERFASRWERSACCSPYADGGRLSELYALGAPIESREDTAGRRPRRRPVAAHDLLRYAPLPVADSAQRETA